MNALTASTNGYITNSTFSGLILAESTLKASIGLTSRPFNYKEGHQLLTDCGWSIRSQVNPTPVSSIGISQFLSPFLPIKLRGDPPATLRSEKLMLMNEILPEIFEPTDNSGLKCPLDEILESRFSPGWTQRLQIDFVRESCELLSQKLTIMDIGVDSDLPATLARATSKGLRAFLDTNAFIEWKAWAPSQASPCLLPRGISTAARLACDGSFEPESNIAALGIYSETGEHWSSRIPGLQKIQRAELFGILGSLWVSRVDSPLEVFTDCLAIHLSSNSSSKNKHH